MYGGSIHAEDYMEVVTMAPEAPGNLVVIDLHFQDGELEGSAERVEYDPEHTARIEEAGGWFYVLWNETPRGDDYVSLGGGVVHVKKDLPHGYRILPKEPIQLDSMGNDRYAYRYPALGEGLMLVLMLPEGYTLADYRPTPRSAKVFQKGRLAVYWKPEAKYGTHVKITWGIKKFDGDLRAERDRINADIDRSENVPDNAGVIVDEPARQDRGMDGTASRTASRTEEIPSWFSIAGVVFGAIALLFLMSLLVLSLFNREIPTASRFILVAFLALSIGLSSTFLGGTAVARGTMSLPLIKESPMSFAVTGGIAAFIIILVLGYFLYAKPPTEPNTPSPSASTTQQPTVFRGPFTGNINHNPKNTFQEVFSSNVDLLDFTAEVVFFNPYAASDSSWDYGYNFRSTGDNEEYRIYVTSKSEWIVELHKLVQGQHIVEQVASGILQNLDLSANGSNYLRLVVNGGTAEFIVNKTHIHPIPATELMKSGDVEVAIGFQENDEVESKTTRFENFTIYTLK
jgi:hypothetical protein